MMDQLVTTSAVDGTALLVDFSDLSVLPVKVPDSAEFVVVHSGESRNLPIDRVRGAHRLNAKPRRFISARSARSGPRRFSAYPTRSSEGGLGTS